MLIASRRHAAEDREAWVAAERIDAVHCQLSSYGAKIDRALGDLDRFFCRGGGYVGVSWGKDSVVLAHLCSRLSVPSPPLVWVRVEPITNPDCALVRDALLAMAPGEYTEIEERCTFDGEWHATGTLERGFARAAERFGARYASGVRAAESGARKLRAMTYGVATAATCAPLSWWSGADVFAYLYEHGLPVHPAYACTMGGLLDRERIRVASLGGKRGTGHGRAEWERRYYGDEMRTMQRQTICPT